MDIDNRSIRNASIIAGVGLLLMAIFAGFGNFGVLQQLVSPDDAAATATDIRDSAGLFRIGMTAMALVPLLDIVVAWSLMTVLNPVNPGLSRLAAWVRAIYAGIFLVAISRLAAIPGLLDGNGLTALSPEQRNDQALIAFHAFNDTWSMGLGLFGFHLLIVGFLAYVSGYMPKWLGALVALAGVGYLIDSFGMVLIDGYAANIGAFTFIGEVVLIGWLLIKGRDLTLPPISESATQPRLTEA